MNVVSKEDAKGLQQSPIVCFGEIYIVVFGRDSGGWRVFTVLITEPAILIAKSKKMPHLANPSCAGLPATVSILRNHEMTLAYSFSLATNNSSASMQK